MSSDASDSKKNRSKSKNLITRKIKESANQIWLAGLGAYAMAEKEGGKLFDSLVKDGQDVEGDARGVRDGVRAGRELGSKAKVKVKMDQKISAYKVRVEDYVEDYKDRVEERVDDLVDDVKEIATSSWEKIEKAFDDRVSRTLARLNIPTKADVDVLSRRVDALTELLSGAKPAKTSVSTIARAQKPSRSPTKSPSKKAPAKK